MALTDYLMQSVVMTLFFYHYTTGLYGDRVGPAIGMGISIVFFAMQIAFSNWWLKSHRFGPMEWLWRGMTYGKFPSMTKDEPVPVLVPATPAIALAAAGAEGGTTTVAESEKAG